MITVRNRGRMKAGENGRNSKFEKDLLIVHFLLQPQEETHIPCIHEKEVSPSIEDFVMNEGTLGNTMGELFQMSNCPLNCISKQLPIFIELSVPLPWICWTPSFPFLGHALVVIVGVELDWIQTTVIVHQKIAGIADMMFLAEVMVCNGK